MISFEMSKDLAKDLAKNLAKDLAKDLAKVQFLKDSFLRSPDMTQGEQIQLSRRSEFWNLKLFIW